MNVTRMTPAIRTAPPRFGEDKKPVLNLTGSDQGNTEPAVLAQQIVDSKQLETTTYGGVSAKDILTTLADKLQEKETAYFSKTKKEK